MSVPGPPRPTPDWQRLACWSCRWLVVVVVLLGVATGVGAASEPVTVGTDDLDGSGTGADPYEISNASELQALEDDLSADYTLVSDINASETDSWDSGKGFDPIGACQDGGSGCTADPFTGRFDGSGYTISNLTINRTVKEVGLFGATDGSTVQDVRLTNVSITGNTTSVAEHWQYVGSLVGVNDGTVDSMFVSGQVDGIAINGTDSRVYAGGIVGDNNGTITQSVVAVNVTVKAGFLAYAGGVTPQNDGRIEASVATGDVTAASGINFSNGEATYAGGLVGSNKNRIENAYASGDVDGDADVDVYVGGLVGYNSKNYITGTSGRVTATYATGTLTATAGNVDKGGLVGINPSGTVDDSYFDNTPANGIGTQLSTADMQGSSPPTTMIGLWDSTVWETVEAGDSDATADGYPILSAVERQRQLEQQGLNARTSVRTWNDLDAVRNDLDGSYLLTDDLDDGVLGYDDVAASSANGGNGFDPIGSFSGTFDGANRTIGNLTVDRATNKVGLFASTQSSATVEYLHLDAVSVVGNDDTGGLVGDNDGTVRYATVDGIINGSDNVGGIVGYSEGTVNGSNATATINGSTDVGGLVGDLYQGSITASTASGDVDGTGVNPQGDTNAGGLVGYLYSSDLRTSNASGNVNGTSENVGGLAGQSYDSTIIGANASGDVNGTTNTGGLVGNANDGKRIENSSATGAVDGADAVGGLVGYGDTDIKQSYATGPVDGGGDVGGLVGHTYGGVITDSNATGAVTGSGDDVGGLVGWVDGSSIEVDASSATGSVTGADQVGGLVGTNRGTVRRSTATGSVTGSNEVGGLVGYGDDDSLVSASSATGAVTGTNRVGGLVGDGYLVTVTASNATGTVDGDEKVGGLVGRSSESTITDSNASGDVAATANDVGGLVGNVTDGKRIENSSATGEVNGSGNVGGLVGYNLNTNITRSYATGHVDGASKVGGLVGWNDGSNRQAITESYATGTVNGTNSIGGLVGWNFGRNLHVQRSFATGTVTATTGGAGGLIGTNRGPVANTSANGTVIGDTAAGGLVGRNTGTISDSLATGTVNNTAASTGGLVAFNNSGVGTAVDAYWDINATNQSTSEGGTGVTTANLTGQSVSTVAGLNDTSVWTPTDSYPVLRWRVEDIGLTLADTDLDVGDSTAATTTLSLAGGGPTTATTTSDYSSDSSVATVDSGTVTTSGLGTATITAEHAGLDASIQLSVIQPPSSGGSSSSICTTGVDITTTDDGTESTADIEQSDTNGTTAVSRDGGQPLAVTANTSIESLSLVTDTHCEFSVTVRADETADRTAANASFESPDAVSTTPVGYLTIQDDLAADELTDATITFSVDTATAADGTITLYRGVGDEWRPMNTTVVNETSAMTQYEADTAEFSTFAIGLNQPQTTDPVDETDDAGTVDELDTGIAGLLLIGLLLIVGLLSVGWWRRDDADRTGETDSE